MKPVLKSTASQTMIGPNLDFKLILNIKDILRVCEEEIIGGKA